MVTVAVMLTNSQDESFPHADGTGLRGKRGHFMHVRLCKVCANYVMAASSQHDF